MALPIRDGNQSLTTLSTLIISNSHVPAHTVVSLGTQAITDIATAVSGVELGPNTLNALENITVTLGQVTITGGLTDAQLRASAVTIGGSVTATISGTPSVTFGTSVITGSTSVLNFPATQTVTFTQASVTFTTATITGSTSILNFPATQTVTFTQITTHGVTIANTSVTVNGTFYQATQPVSLTTLPALAAGTAQIGSVTATISGTPSVTFTQASITFGTAVITGSASIVNFPTTQPVSIASVTIGNSITISSLPAISGTVTANNVIFNDVSGFQSAVQAISDIELNAIRSAIWIADSSGSNGSASEGQILSQNYPMPISGTVTANTFALQGTAVTTSNFTSTTASTVLASFNATREVLTIFNEGAGNLHICAGATCTTIAYQVRLSAGDYYEVPNHQTTITHSAVFATAGTARVTQLF
jgi:hypothetical protein